MRSTAQPSTLCPIRVQTVVMVEDVVGEARGAAQIEVLDPQTAKDRQQFATLLKALMKASGRAPAGIGRSGLLSRSTVYKLLAGESEVKRETIASFLQACAVPRERQRAWLDKHAELYPRQVPEPVKQITASAGWVMAGVEARGHFTRRSRGHRNRWSVDDLFRGRAAALAAVLSWVSATRAPGCPLVITGQPGAGKSALLARAVLDLESAQQGVRGVAVHARGATFAEVLTAVAEGARLRGGALADEVLRALSGHDGPVLAVAVDALDEVTSDTDRDAIVDLLVELARLPRLRVMVATRALSTGDRYSPAALLPSLGVRSSYARHLIDLDSDRYFDPVGLSDFVTAVLTQDLPGGSWAAYRSDVVLTGRLAAAVCDRARRNYLVAALAATDLGSDDSPVDPADEDFDSTRIPSTVGEAVSKYLGTLPRHEQAATRALLTALAYARGEGIDDQRWRSFATALGYPTTALDLDTLRRTPASGYLLHTSTDHSGRITRLFHQALADELLADRPHRRGDEQQLLSTLLPTDSADWHDSDSYTRTHASEHAHAAGQLSRLLNDPAYLTIADLNRLLPLLRAHTDRADAPMITVLRRAFHSARSLPPARRAALLALAAGHLGLPEIQRRVNSLCGLTYPVAWAHAPGIAHRLLSGHTEEVSAVAIGRLGERDVIASADFDGEIRLWDAQGQPIGSPLTGHPTWVSALAIGRLGEREVIVSADYGDSDGTCGELRLWDAEGQPIGDPLAGHTSTVNAVAIGRLGERDVVVSAGDGGEVRLWDAEGQPIGGPLAGYTRSVGAVAIGRLGERDVIVSAGDGGEVRLWDAEGQPIGDPLAGHARSVGAVAIGRLGERDVVVSADYGGEVRLWDAEGQPVHDPLADRTDRIRAVAAVNLGEHVVLVLADGGGEVQLSDANGKPIGEPVGRHITGVSAVAIGRLGERDVIVFVDPDDGSEIELWDIAEQPIGRPTTGHTSPISTIAVGRLGERDVIVSADYDGEVRLWDAGGQPIGEPLIGHDTWVSAVAIGRLGERDVIVSGGDDGEVRLWDAGGQPIGEPLIGHDTWVTAVAIGRLGERDVIASAGDFGGIDGGTGGEVQLWDADAEPIGEPLTVYSDRVRAVAIGRLGERDVIAAGDGNTVRLWDADGQSIGDPLTGHNDSVTAVAIGRLGERDVVAAGDYGGEVRLWGADGKLIGDPLTAHTDWVHAVIIGRLGERDAVISASEDGTIRIWDGKNETVTFLDSLQSVTGVALLSDGRGLCAATGMALCSWAPHAHNGRRSSA